MVLLLVPGTDWQRTKRINHANDHMVVILVPTGGSNSTTLLNSNILLYSYICKKYPILQILQYSIDSVGSAVL